MWLRVVLIFEGLWILSCDVCNILVNEITQKSRRLSRLPCDKTNHAMENGVALSFSLYFGRRANRKRAKNNRYWWCIPGNFVSCRLFRRLVEGSRMRLFEISYLFQNWDFVVKGSNKIQKRERRERGEKREKLQDVLKIAWVSRVMFKKQVIWKHVRDTSFLEFW